MDNLAKKQKIAVLGAGSWGTALAMVLLDNGHDVCLWGNKELDVQKINTHHVNEKYLPGIQLPSRLCATASLEKALEGVDAVVFVVPTGAIRDVAKQVSRHLTTRPYIIHAAKGLEQITHKRISEVLCEEIAQELYQDVVVLSGPSHAEEVANKDLTSITAASINIEAARYVQELFMNQYFRIYTNSDVIGVELGAALKNVIAIGAGIIHGLGYGDNANAALVTRGLAEVTRFGMAYGASKETFSGLSGVGDLIVTCTSVHSRNWRLGDMLGSGMTFKEAMDKIDMAVEGAWTVKVAYELSQEKNIDMPITKAIYDVLYNNVQARNAIVSLMMRQGKSE